MNHFRLSMLAFFFAVTMSITSSARAQNLHSWVSGVGDDANPCSRTAPCKTFAGAISKTAVAGKIDLLDPAGVGTVMITRSVSLDGGNMASVLANGVAGITINITDPTDTAKTVRLRGLSINGGGFTPGTQGISIVAANKVSVENTVIDGFTANGIDVAAGQLFVKNTIIRNNGGAGINAVAGTHVALSDMSVIFNGIGLVGPVGTIVRFENIVLYGNQNGGPSPRRAKRR